ITPIAASATLLAFWFREAGLGNATQSQAQAVLDTIGIRDQNPSRGIKNSDWPAESCWRPNRPQPSCDLESHPTGKMFPLEVLERVEGNFGRIALKCLRPHAARLWRREPGNSIAQVLRRPIQPREERPSIAEPMDRDDGISKTPCPFGKPALRHSVQ